MAEVIELEQIQYIELTRDAHFREFLGRTTLLHKGAYGVILTENTLEKIVGLTEEQEEDLIRRIEEAQKNGGFLALVAGYVCGLREDNFKRLKEPPKITPIPDHII